jgi:POT family proton-dependent oligopeptide transporter
MIHSNHPRGLYALFFAELWERFSYYGMRGLMMPFMMAPVVLGGLGFEAKYRAMIYGTYTMSVYMLSIPGGFIADNFLGARRSVLVGGVIISAGHFTLAVRSETAFFIGLILIALGTGLLKPNISTMVGALYKDDDSRRDAGFSIFYMGINLGAFLAPLVTGWLAQSNEFKVILRNNGLDPLHCWHWGFAAAGVGMLIGLAVYVFTGKQFAHVGLPPAKDKPRPWGMLGLVLLGAAGVFGLVHISDTDPRFEWIRYGYIVVPILAILWFGFRDEVSSRRLAAILIYSLAAIVFWAIFEQAGSSISVIAENLTHCVILGYKFPSAWFQSVNSLFVVMLAPLFAILWARWGAGQPSSPMKFVYALVFLGISFVLMVPAAKLTALGKIGPMWLVWLFFIQTIGEMCLSPVGLSTMTKLAPTNLVGLVMGIWFLATALGSKLAGVLAGTFEFINEKQLATELAGKLGDVPGVAATNITATLDSMLSTNLYTVPREQLAGKLSTGLADTYSSIEPAATADVFQPVLNQAFAQGGAEMSDFFLHQALWVGVATVVLLACVPWLKRLMGDVK